MRALYHPLPLLPPPTEVVVEGWSSWVACERLSITQVPFNPKCKQMGYSNGNELAVSPNAPTPKRTFFHEAGHIILGHTWGGSSAPLYVKEIQAEVVARDCLTQLGINPLLWEIIELQYIYDWTLFGEVPPSALEEAHDVSRYILAAGCVGGPKSVPTTP